MSRASPAVLAETIDREIERDGRPLLRNTGANEPLEFYEQGGSRSELPQLVVVIDKFADLASTLSPAPSARIFLGLSSGTGSSHAGVRDLSGP